MAKSSEKYSRCLRDLNSFVEALGRLLEVMEKGEGFDLLGTPGGWTPRPGKEAEAGRRKAAVDLVAGRAAYAFQAAGSYISFKPSGTWQTVPVNPATEWATILEWAPKFDVETIMTCARQSKGLLEMNIEEAEEYERDHVQRVADSFGRLTGKHLRPVGRWAVRTAGSLALLTGAAGVAYWLGWH